MIIEILSQICGRFQDRPGTQFLLNALNVSQCFFFNFFTLKAVTTDDGVHSSFALTCRICGILWIHKYIADLRSRTSIDGSSIDILFDQRWLISFQKWFHYFMAS